PPRVAPGFWGALGWLVVWLFVCQFIPGFIAAFVADLTGRPFSQFKELVLLSGQVMGATLAVIVLCRRLGWGWVSELGLNRLPLVPTLLAILSVPGLKVLLTGVVLLFGAVSGAQDPAKDLVMQSASSVPWW